MHILPVHIVFYIIGMIVSAVIGGWLSSGSQLDEGGEWLLIIWPFVWAIAIIALLFELFKWLIVKFIALGRGSVKLPVISIHMPRIIKWAYYLGFLSLFYKFVTSIDQIVHFIVINLGLKI